MQTLAFWRPMRRRLPLLITTLLCASVGAISWLAYQRLARVLIDAGGDRVVNVANRLSAAFGESAVRMRTVRGRLNTDSAVVRYFTVADAATTAGARAALDRYRKSNPQIMTVELYDRLGERLLATSTPAFEKARVGRDGPVLPYTTGSPIGPFVARGDSIYSEVRQPVILGGGDTVGVVREIQRVASGQGGDLVRSLIGNNAVLLIGNSTGDLWTDMAVRVGAPPAPHPTKGATQATGTDGVAWVGTTVAVPNVPWLIWVALPRTAVLAPAHAFLVQIGGLALAVILIGALVSWLLGRHITKPLAAVIDAAESIAAGNYGHRVPESGSDEMGQLASAFNAMTGHIATATQDLEAQQVELELSNQELEEAVERADRSAEELRAVVEGSPLAICTLDPEGIVTSWNPAAERMFGWTSGEAMGRFHPAVPQGSTAEFLEHRRRVIAGERVRGQQCERRCKDGSMLQVSLFGAPLHAPNGKLTGLLALYEDITEQNRVQVELASERRFLRQVIDINPNFVFTKDRAGRYQLANQAVAEAYGTTPEELVGKTDADFNRNPEEVEAFRRADEEVIDSGKTLVIPEEMITDVTGKVRWLHTIKRPIINEHGGADQLLGVAMEITERKQLQAQLLQAQKMEAVGQLAGGVAHDFNNVLTAIKSFSELVALELAEDSPIRSDVAEIIAAADRAAALTQQLLAFSRRQVLQSSVLSPNAVVERVTKLLVRLIGAEVRCETILAADLGNVLADPGQLEQVLINLAVNARDAMPHGGTVTIETCNVTLDEEHAAHLSGLEAAEPGEYVLISVSDTGIGMDRALLARIFEPFFTTKDVGKGTGLGLSTVYGIVRQSGGYVGVYSEPQHGTAFRVYLPRAGGAAIAPAAKAVRTEMPAATQTILLVDDDEAVRAVATRILTRAGYDVLSASSPREAQTVWAEYEGPIDLLMTDLMMPDMDGGELARRLLEARPTARVLYTSGYTSETVVRRGLVIPEMTFLSKPFTIDTVLRKVRDALMA